MSLMKLCKTIIISDTETSPKFFFGRSNIFGQKFEAGEKIFCGHIRVLESNVLLPMMYPEVFAYGWI